MTTSRIGFALLAATCLTACTAAAFGSEGAANTKLTVNAPENGNNEGGAVAAFAAKLENAPAERIFVRIELAGITHHVIIDPEDPWTGNPQTIFVSDRWLLAPKGPNEMKVDLIDMRERVFYTTSVPVTIKPPEFERFEMIRDNALNKLTGAASLIHSNWRDFTSAMHEAKAGLREVSDDDLRFKESYYLSYVNHDLMQRTSAYVDMAEVHEEQFEPGDALACLRFAEEIFEKEKEKKTSTPHYKDFPITQSPVGPSWAPSHFEGYAVFYARRGALSNAVSWLEKEADWYIEQSKLPHIRAEEKDGILKNAAESYRKIAHLHVILNKDVEGYDRYIKKFRDTLPESCLRRNYTTFGPVQGLYR